MRSKRPGLVLISTCFAIVALPGMLLLLVQVRPAHAHTPHDVIADVGISPNFAQDATVYVIVRQYLLKSTDGGENWKRLVRGLDNKSQLGALAVSHQDPEVLYVGSRGDGVYRSTDAGLSWSKANTGLEGHHHIDSLVASPHDEVFAISRGRLFRTTTGGDSWERVSGHERLTAVAFAPDDPGVLVVGDEDGGVQRSDDRGETWTETAFHDTRAGSVSTIAVSPSFSFDRTFFVGTDSDGVFATSDGGTSFSEASSGLTDLHITSLAVSPRYPTDRTAWAVTWTEGAFASMDGGASWSSASDGLTTSQQADLVGRPHFEALWIAAPSGEDEQPTMFLAGFDGLFRASDPPVWKELDTQIPSNITGLALSPAYLDDATVAVATYVNGAFLSTDHGATWIAINTGLATRHEWARRPDYFARLLGIWFSPTYPADERMFTTIRGLLLTSSDSGEAWTSQTPLGLIVENERPPDALAVAFSPDFERDDVVMLGGNRGKMFHSQDGGRSFSMVADLGHKIASIVIPPGFDDDGKLFIESPSGLFLANPEDGTSSRVVNQRATGFAVSPSYDTDGTAFLGTPNGLLVTRDAGTVWTRPTDAALTSNYIEAVALSPAYETDGTVLVSVRGHGLFKSTDGGESFQTVAQDLLDDNHVLSSFYHRTSPPIVFSPAFATDQTVYGIAEEHLFRSTNGGESWNRIELPVTLHDTTAEAAPAPLLETPEWHPGLVESVSSSRGFETPIGTLSVRRVAAAAGAAVLTFLLSWPLRLILRVSGPPLAARLGSSFAVRIGCSLAVFVAALVILAA